MKITAINGSPREGGNTDILLEKVLEGARSAGADTAKVTLNRLDISPCQAEEYENVAENGFSVIKDDIHGIFRCISESDAVVLGSPIFFGSISAQLKTMIDRFQCVWVSRNILGKEILPPGKGAFVCVEATDREDFQNDADRVVRHFFKTINMDYTGHLFCRGIEKKGDIEKRPDYLEQAFAMGSGLAVSGRHDPMASGNYARENE